METITWAEAEKRHPGAKLLTHHTEEKREDPHLLHVWLSGEKSGEPDIVYRLKHECAWRNPEIPL